MGTAEMASRRSIAALLRDTGAGLGDAHALLDRGSQASAARILGVSVEHLAQAVMISEGLQVGDPGSVPPENPMKHSLERASARVTAIVKLLGRGSVLSRAQRDSLPALVSDIEVTLTRVAEHFGVDLNGIGPAKTTSPIRIPKAHIAEPVRDKEQQKSDRKPTPKKKSLPAAAKSSDQRPHQAKPSEPDATGVQKPTQARVETSPPKEVHHVVEPPPTKLRPAPPLTSSFFWDLMADWHVPDVEALALIGHTGGLTKRGKRPRFKLSEGENEKVSLCKRLDDALRSAGLDPASWVHGPVKGAPFKGQRPLAFMTSQGADGLKRANRFVFQKGLEGSLKR